MMRALYTAGTGMKAQQLKVDVVAHNLANANTAGFKRSQVDFQDLLYVSLKQPGLKTAKENEQPTGLEIGSGTRAVATTKVFSQGTLEETRRDLDVAIQGEGFFQVLQPDGLPAYTRDGAFRLSSDGTLVTAEGLRVVPAVRIPSDAVGLSIGRDGTVSVTIAGEEATPRVVGQLTLARFSNPAGLESLGGNLFAPSASSGEALLGTADAEGFGSLNQRFLERSNVDTVTELVNLILTQRAYEVNARAVKASDEMLQETNNMSR